MTASALLGRAEARTTNARHDCSELLIEWVSNKRFIASEAGRG